MFTGIIEEIGQIKRIVPIAGGKRLTISASKVLNDLKVDHSISISGACLTVIDISNHYFTVEAVGETLAKSTIGRLRINAYVNLERALKFNDRLGGHLIQGHINAITKIKQITKRGNNWYLEIMIPDELDRYMIKEGSIAIDGMSLTIASINHLCVGVSIIPYTYKNTITLYYKNNQEVNIEVDFLARHIEKIILNNNRYKKQEITKDKEWLNNLG